MGHIVHIFNDGIYRKNFEKHVAENKDSHKIVNHEAFKSISLSLLRLLLKSDRVIIHQLNSPKIAIILYFISFIQSNLAWISWGGDQYFILNKQKKIKQRMIQLIYKIFIYRVRFIGAQMPQDLANLCKVFGKGKKYRKVIYPIPYDNLNISDYRIPDKSVLHVMCGNSAGETNNHDELIDKCLALEKQFGQIFKFHFPFSYGGTLDYKKRIKLNASVKLGQYVEFLEVPLAIDEYQNFLNTIDIVLFAHNRQQGLGNLYPLVYRGAIACLKESTSSYDYFKSNCAGIYDLQHDIENLILSENEKKKNSEFVVSEMSLVNILRSWEWC